MIDSHCHINHEGYIDKPEEYIRVAKQNGVNFFLVVGWDIKSSINTSNLSEKFAEIYSSVGVHPVDSLKINTDDLLTLEELVKSNNKIIAIGEIGLDYHWCESKEEKEIQKKWFIEQIKLANKLNLPVIIHSRDASEDTYDILKNNKVIKGGIMHCYSSSPEMVSKFLELGFYLSFGGPLTFTNAKTPKESCSITPINRLFIETDSPYLTPHPYRGTQNHSKYLYLVEEEACKLHNVSKETLRVQIRDNFNELFHVKTKDELK